MSKITSTLGIDSKRWKNVKWFAGFLTILRILGDFLSLVTETGAVQHQVAQNVILKKKKYQAIEIKTKLPLC